MAEIFTKTNMKKILVTGGSGFIGSHVGDHLSNKGFEVTIYDKKKSRYLKKNQKFIKGDILDFYQLEKAIKKCTYVYHFAGLSDLNQAVKEPFKSVKLNILATVKLLDLCLKYKVKRFIHASSIYANSKDGGFYRSSKKAAEEYIEEYKNIYNLKFTVLRFGSLYGIRAQKNNGLNKILLKAINEKKIQYQGTANSIREYINVEDAARGSVEVLKKKYENKYVIITGNKKIKLFNLLNYIKKSLHIKTKIKFSHNKNSHLGHYTSNPFTYKPYKGKKLKIKNQKVFFNEIDKYITNREFK